jgi:hypothetical protein
MDKRSKHIIEHSFVFVTLESTHIDFALVSRQKLQVSIFTETYFWDATMNIDSLLDSGYSSTTAASRALVSVRIERIADRLRDADQTLAFVLRFLGLRIGPLRAIPAWLEVCARACDGPHPEVADGLRAAAQTERAHQLALLEDLRELFEVVGRVPAQGLVMDTHDPRIARHSAIRALVPTRSEPLVVIGIDLELAELGRVLGPMLLEVCRRHLGPGVDACRWIRARTENAELRTPARVACLAALLQQYPERGRGWAQVAIDVTQSYLGALEACAEQRRAPLPLGNLELEGDEPEWVVA